MKKLKKKGDLYFPSEELKKKAWVKSRDVYDKGSTDPIKFWEELAAKVYWRKKWSKSFEHHPPYFKWFVGGKLNITESALDQQLSKKGNKIALIWEPEPIEQNSKTFTYSELFKKVNQLANGLKKLGVKKGDRVAIYLPMIPEAIISMLACARIGAIHSVVFSAYSPAALKIRLEDSQAKILITADGYYRNGEIVNLKEGAEEGLKNTQVKNVIVVKRAKNKIPWDKKRDVCYQELVENEGDFCPAEIIDAEDALFILYTSGSTDRPKGCLHTCGGYTIQAKFTGQWIFDLQETDIFWSTADIGWITGHTYSCYAPLLNGATFVIYEGSPFWPKEDRWASLIEKNKVTIFYTAPTAIRMFEKYGEKILEKYSFKSLRLLGSVGEPIDEAAWSWYFKKIGKERCPLLDTWWQTETGGILITSLPGVGPFKPAFAGLPFPGVKFDILDKDGRSCPPDKEGDLVILPPFSPGLLREVYKNPQRYLKTYWSEFGRKVYYTSDGAYRDENGLIRIVGRMDDVIKVAGHRLTTGELEAAINHHPDITECAVVGIPDKIKGQAPAAFIILKRERQKKEIKNEVLLKLRQEIGPIASVKEVYLVPDLPKTRSGKIMRRILRNLFTSEDLGDLSTLANPDVVDRLKKIIEGE